MSGFVLSGADFDAQAGGTQAPAIIQVSAPSSSTMPSQASVSFDMTGFDFSAVGAYGAASFRDAEQTKKIDISAIAAQAQEALSEIVKGMYAHDAVKTIQGINPQIVAKYAVTAEVWIVKMLGPGTFTTKIEKFVSSLQESAEYITDAGLKSLFGSQGWNRFYHAARCKIMASKNRFKGGVSIKMNQYAFKAIQAKLAIEQALNGPSAPDRMMRKAVRDDSAYTVNHTIAMYIFRITEPGNYGGIDCQADKDWIAACRVAQALMISKSSNLSFSTDKAWIEARDLVSTGRDEAETANDFVKKVARFSSSVARKS